MPALPTAIAALLITAAPSARKLVVLTAIEPRASEQVTARSVRGAVEAAVRRRIGLSLAAEGETAGGADLFAACGSDVPCFADRLRPEGADLGLLVFVNLATQPALVVAQLFDVRVSQPVGTLSGRVTAAEGGVAGAAGARTAKLLDAAAFPEAAVISADVVPLDAAVTIEDASGRRVARARSATVSAGLYRIHAERDGYEAASAGVTAIGGRTARVAIALKQEAALLESPFFWGAIVAAVAGGVTAGILLARSPSDACLCFGDDPSVCDRCP